MSVVVPNLTNDTVKYNSYRKATFLLEETLCGYLGQASETDQLNYLTTYFNTLRSRAIDFIAEILEAY